MNRNGRLAEGQREIMERRIGSTRWFYLGFCVLFIGLAVLFSVGIYSEVGGDDEILPVIVGMDVVIVLLTLPLIWRMRREIRKVRDDLAEGRVASHSGAVTLGYKGQTLMVGISDSRCRAQRAISYGARHIRCTTRRVQV